MTVSSLVTTPGATNANAYVTVAEASQYLEDQFLDDNVWLNASDQDARKAILQATRLMDRLIEWRGYVVNYTQALMWPRTGLYYRNGDYIPHDVIPEDLKNSTAAFARDILERAKSIKGDAESHELEKLARVAERHGLSSVQFRETSVSFGTSRRENIIPREVFDLIPPEWVLASRSMTVDLVRA